MAATDAVIPPLYFLRVDQLMKNDFLCPVTDIVHMAYRFSVFYTVKNNEILTDTCIFTSIYRWL